MDGQQFDTFVRRFAGSTSRRKLIAAFSVAAIGSRIGVGNVAMAATCVVNDNCGNCEYCNSGTCTFVDSGSDPYGDCNPGVCNGAGQCGCLGPLSSCEIDQDCCAGGELTSCLDGHCRLNTGTQCQVAYPDWCASGYCVDAICCSTACDDEIEDTCLKASCPGGVCSTAAKDCTDLDEVCKTGVCSDGGCIAENRADGIECGFNLICQDGECICPSGYVMCDGYCRAGVCCINSDCPPSAIGTCASVMCQDYACIPYADDDKCSGSCQQCDTSTMTCSDTCGNGTCCCSDETCSAECCPSDLCEKDGDCPSGECCCKDGSCDSECCESGSKPTPTITPEPPKPPKDHHDSTDSSTTTLPQTGSGKASVDQSSIAGLAAVGGAFAWAALKIRGKTDQSRE